MIIHNISTAPDGKSADYYAHVGRRNETDIRKAFTNPVRMGQVIDYARNSYNVWRLVARALKAAFPEENKREGSCLPVDVKIYKQQQSQVQQP